MLYSPHPLPEPYLVASRCLAALAAFLLIVAACSPTPTPQLTPVGTPTAGPSPTPAPPTATLTPAPTPTPVPVELVICQTAEPASLYWYGDNVAARDAIFSALYDGPIDTAGFSLQPVILEALPSVEAGTAGLVEVEVQPGQRVLDAATGALVPLVEGVQLAQLDGTVLAYAGTAPARTVQTWAEFGLRPGLRWSDGEPLTAADAVFGYEVAASPETPASKFVTDRTAGYAALDEQRLRWTGLPGWVDPDFAQRFWPPLPRHRYASYSPAQLLALPEANEAPLGWGAFMLPAGGWVKGQRLTLVRNPYYTSAQPTASNVDQVTFRFGLAPDRILSELEAGACHVAPASVDFGARLAEVLQAGEAGRLAVQVAPDRAFEHLDFGILPAEDYRRPAGDGLFQDVRVRQAVAFCLDRQALIDQLQAGLSEVPVSYVPASHPYFAGGQLAQYPFDPARGQALLAEAGWQDANGDGVRESGRNRLSVQLVTGPADNEFRAGLAAFIQAQLLANCGLEVVPALQTPEALAELWPTGVVFGRRFDLASFPWRTGSQPPCDLYLSQAIPSAENPGGANNTGYSNPAFDAACNAAQQALDESTRRANHVAAQAIFTQDLPSLPLFFRAKLGVAHPSVQGYQLDPTAPDLWNLEAISLAPAGGL